MMIFFPQPPPKLPQGVFSSDFQDFVTKWWVSENEEYYLFEHLCMGGKLSVSN